MINIARIITKNSGSSEKITTLKDIDKKINELVEEANLLDSRSKLKLLSKLGVGIGCTSGLFFTCTKCGRVLEKKKFYVSTASNQKSGITSICKDCAENIAVPVVDGCKKSPDKNSVDRALYALDKPFLDSVWDASLLEAANTATGKIKSNVWTSYIKNIQLPNYYSLTYKESDNYTGGIYSLDDMKEDVLPNDQEIIEHFEKNKKDALRLLGYLPFEKEKLSDQPFLYSQLLGFLDASGEGNDDMMRTSSIISIVRGFLQQAQIDDMIAGLVQDSKSASQNVATIKSLQDMKRNITIGITKLAESSCISLKHSKNSIKGENTWTGKIKKIKDLNLRGTETNGFDMATCRGMQQVQEISDASIMKQLHLDDSDWSDMVAEMRVESVAIRKERDAYKEINRILLRENLDLKDTLSENSINFIDNIVDLKDVYSVFSEIRENESTDIMEEEGNAELQPSV